jgi:putative ABC transport system permease protein
MGWLNILKGRLRALFQRESVLQDIEEELRAHIEIETETNIKRGMLPDEARAAALKSFGNTGRNTELGYHIRGGGWLDALYQDLRYGARMLMKQPGFTLITALTLALGIGANAAIFTMVNSVLLRPLPYDRPDRLVMLWESNPRRNIENQRVSPPNLVEWREQSRSFENIAYWTGAGEFNLIMAGAIEKAECAYVTSSLFSTLRVKPYLGRAFLPEEDQLEGNRVALLNYEYWRRRFAADPNVIGQMLTLGRRDYTIVGVMQPGFRFPNQTEIWLPVGWDGIPRQRRGPWLSVIARLKDGVALTDAQAEMNVIQERIEHQYPQALIGSQVAIIPLLEQTLGARLRSALLILWGVVVCVLLIACANVANLLLARAAERQKEIAIRLALGVSRIRMIRQLLTESMLLALLGAVLGLLLAGWSLNLLIAFNADQVPRLGESRLDIWSLAFTMLVACLTGLIFGLAPAWQSTKVDLNVALKDSGRGATENLQRNRLRALLIVTEVALSLVLSIGAGLAIRSFAHMTRVDRGFQPEHLLTAKLDFTVSGFTGWVRPTETRPQVTIRELMERLNDQPGVQSVAAEGIRAAFQVTIENRQTGREEDYPRSSVRGVTPDYFRALGVSMLRGRTFNERDALEAPRVAILSEALARRCFRNENPIGKRIYLGRLNPGQIGELDRWTNVSLWYEIVGTVADVKSQNLDPQIEPNVYVPYWQWPMEGPTLYVRTVRNPANFAAALYSEIKALNKNLPAPEIRTMNDRLADVVAGPRFQTLLLGLFGLVALTLVIAGIYGVVSYSVAQRAHEIGIRLALGAGERDILRLVIGQGMRLVGVGLAIGLVGAFALTRLMKTLLFGVSANDPLTFGSTALLLALVALLACWIPARRATKVDPLQALRHD